MADILKPTEALQQLRRLCEGIRDERHTYANTATRIGNAFLALLSYIAGAPFLRKDTDDTTTHKLTMGEAEVKGTAALRGGVTIGADGTYSITEEGVARLVGVVADYLKSSDFHPGTAMGFDGTGYGMTRGTDGKYTLETDNIIARMKMTVAELDVHEMSFIGGTVVMSPCGNRIDLVEVLNASGNVITDGSTPDRYRCYFLATDGEQSIKNEWTIGQLARCKTNNLSKGTYTDYENRDYWRLVVGVSSEPVSKSGKTYHYIDLSNSSAEQITLTDSNGTQHIVTIGGVDKNRTSVPMPNDNVVGIGHQWDTDRQDVAIISASGWTLYKGIGHYDLPHENIINKFGIDEAIVTTDRLKLIPYAQSTDVQTALCVRGEYSATASYGHNDVVTYGGQSWVCAVKIGDTCKGQAPSATSTYWLLFVAKGDTGATGPQGIQGEKGDGYTISFLLNDVPVDVINFDSVKVLESATLEADFHNNAESVNVNKAVITCYDAEGNVLGSPIEASNADKVVVDAGNLYLSKDCKNITVVGKDESGNLLVSKSIGVVRNGKDATELISLVLYLTSGALTWRSGQGKIATLAAAVTKGNYDITDAQDASQFIWTRESSSSQGDKDWNSQHKFGSKTLEVSEGDMCGNITSFVCTLHKSTGEVYTMAKQDFTI